jgi:hypothetical protein
MSVSKSVGGQVREAIVFKSVKEIDAIRGRCNDVENDLIDEFWAGRITRREFLRYGAVLGIPTSANVSAYFSTSLLIDNVSGALAAYSLRRVRRAHIGPAVNIRRDSDNTTRDIGFAGDDFDVASFNAFVGAGTGYVAIWYDQTGNAQHATAIGGLSANQSPIALSATPTGKTAIKATATNQGLIAATPSSGAVISFATVSNRIANFGSYQVLVSFDGNNPGLAYRNTPGGGFIVGNVKVAVTGGAACTDNAFHSGVGIMANPAAQVWADNNTTATASFAANTGSTQIDLIGRSGFGFVGYIAEAFIWNRAITAGEIATIRNNHNAYYGTP